MLNQIRLMLIIVVCLPILAATGCNGSANDSIEDDIDTLTNKIEERVDDLQDEYQEYRDENFVEDAIAANKMELHLLQLAQQKGTNVKLREEAKKMEADHTQLDNTLRSYARANNMEIKEDAEVNTGLNDKEAGNDWDNEWTDKMIDEHQQLIRRFENARDKSLSTELKEIVNNALPTLRNHLNSAESLKMSLR